MSTLNLRQALAAEIDTLTRLSKVWQKKLDLYIGSEDQAGKIRTLIGMSKLLLTDKFEQFKTLLNRYEKRDFKPKEPMNLNDLEAFWDLISIQVEDTKLQFQQLDTNKSDSSDELKQSPVVPKKRHTPARKMRPRSACPNSRFVKPQNIQLGQIDPDDPKSNQHPLSADKARRGSSAGPSGRNQSSNQSTPLWLPDIPQPDPEGIQFSTENKFGQATEFRERCTPSNQNSTPVRLQDRSQPRLSEYRNRKESYSPVSTDKKTEQMTTDPCEKAGMSQPHAYLLQSKRRLFLHAKNRDGIKKQETRDIARPEEAPASTKPIFAEPKQNPTLRPQISNSNLQENTVSYTEDINQDSEEPSIPKRYAFLQRKSPRLFLRNKGVAPGARQRDRPEEQMTDRRDRSLSSCKNHRAERHSLVSPAKPDKLETAGAIARASPKQQFVRQEKKIRTDLHRASISDAEEKPLTTASESDSDNSTKGSGKTIALKRSRRSICFIRELAALESSSSDYESDESSGNEEMNTTWTFCNDSMTRVQTPRKH